MKKMFNVLMSLFVVAMVFSCGDASEEAAEGSKNAAGEWDKVAKEYGLSPADVAKAVEIGTKMKPFKDNLESKEYDDLSDEYTSYCLKTFGTDDYHDEGEGGKKNEGFREIMFATREK
ncbi:hypothetical protein N9O13_02110 [Crocinitomicaceae bacterium]|nr:hypothetical protein [Crocinitomicaceae bacterium]